MKNTTQKIVISSMFAALACVATMIIKIPSGLNGYLNLGDCVVLLAGWMLSPVYAFLAAGIGSALADVLSGYMLYAPVTFLIKGTMAVAAYVLFSVLSKNQRVHMGRIISGLAAECVMILGYYTFEAVLYGAKASLVNISGNALQGAAGLVMGIFLVNAFKKAQIFDVFSWGSRDSHKKVQ